MDRDGYGHVVQKHMQEFAGQWNPQLPAWHCQRHHPVHHGAVLAERRQSLNSILRCSLHWYNCALF